MEIKIAYGTENIDWPSLCNLIRISPLGVRDPGKLKIAAENSFVVCSAFVGDEIYSEKQHKSHEKCGPNEYQTCLSLTFGPDCRKISPLKTDGSI